MKKFRTNRFTMVELLGVIGIMALLFGMFVPAFNRMMFGGKVDQMASNFKTAIEVAQSKAVSSRKHVALILPSNYDDISDARLKPFCCGGYRMAYVNKDGSSWKFAGWVPGVSWSNMADGAMLAAMVSAKDWYNTEGDRTSGLKDIPDLTDDLSDSVLWWTDSSTGVEERKSLLSKIECPLDSSGNIADDDMLALGSDENRSGVILTPFGGISGHTSPLLFFFTEAKNDGAEYEYPNEYNFLVLRLNPITGKVVYLAEEDDR